MAGREFELPSEEERARDREILEALDERQSVGEQYARAGEVPLSTEREPTMRPDPQAGVVRDPTPVRPLAQPPRSVARRVLQVVVLCVLALLAYGLFSYWQVWSTGRSDEAQPVDAIVVLGAAQYDGRPSPQLAARLDHALTLWPEGLAPMIVVTGGNQPGDRFTEADASAAYLAERGVPTDAIVLEGEGASTYESLKNVAAMLGGTVDSVLIVTDPYHALRSRMTAADLGFEAYVSPTPTSVVTGMREVRRELGEAAGVAVGRIIGFDRLSGLTS
ncbi:MAG: YdcF family protein [Ilumatobacteraceae bacterium]